MAQLADPVTNSKHRPLRSLDHRPRIVQVLLQLLLPVRGAELRHGRLPSDCLLERFALQLCGGPQTCLLGELEDVRGSEARSTIGARSLTNAGTLTQPTSGSETCVQEPAEEKPMGVVLRVPDGVIDLVQRLLGAWTPDVGVHDAVAIMGGRVQLNSQLQRPPGYLRPIVLFRSIARGMMMFRAIVFLVGLHMFLLCHRTE